MKAPALPPLSVLVLTVACALPLAGCRHGAPRQTLLVRAFLGASEDGGYAVAELQSEPGAAPRGTTTLVSSAGRVRSTPLAADVARAAAEQAGVYGDAPRPIADLALSSLARPEGHSPGRAARLAVHGATSRWPVEPLPGVRALVELQGADGRGPLRVLLRVDGEPQPTELYRLDGRGRCWATELLLLPGNRLGLLRLGCASRSRGELHRVEEFAEIRLGEALAARLDARALAAVEQRDLRTARAELERAVDLAPRDATAHYNLACVLALSGEADAALLRLGRAIDLEPVGSSAAAQRDPDLDSLRERVEFQLMVETRRQP